MVEGWSGVGVVRGERIGARGGSIYSRSPVHGGHGAGAVQRPHGLAVGVVWGRLWCWATGGHGGGVEASWACAVVGDGLGSDLAVRRTHGRRVPGEFGSLLGVVQAREGAGEVVGSGVG